MPCGQTQLPHRHAPIPPVEPAEFEFDFPQTSPHHWMYHWKSKLAPFSNRQNKQNNPNRNAGQRVLPAADQVLAPQQMIQQDAPSDWLSRDSGTGPLLYSRGSLAGGTATREDANNASVPEPMTRISNMIGTGEVYTLAHMSRQSRRPDGLPTRVLISIKGEG